MSAHFVSGSNDEFYERAAQVGEYSWECEHPIIRFAKRTIRDGSERYGMQCMRCGSATPPGLFGLTRSKEVFANRWIAAEPWPWDEEIKNKHQDRALRSSNLQFHQRDDAQRKNRRERYIEHLKSSEWQRLRQLILYRCGGKCEGCGEAGVTEVHHTTYEHVGNEFLFELLGLCRRCHARLHEKAA